MICGCGCSYFIFCTTLVAFVLSYSDQETCPADGSVCGRTMKSIRHNEAENTVRLENDTPLPQSGEGDILIKVAAAGVNRLDLSQRKGQYPPPPGTSDILGVEVSGTVSSLSATAEESSGFKVGDRVMALIGGGGYAEYTTAPYQCVMPIPQELTFEQAAAIPEVYLTAYQAIVWNGYLKDGESVLIHAAASGVGTAAIQIAKALYSNVTVIATSRTQSKLSLCAKCGADVLIDSKEQDFSEEVMKATREKGADLIVDFIGGPYWEKNVNSLAVDGRLMIVSFLGGPIVPSPTVSLAPILRKRLTVRGSTLRSRSLEYKERLVKEVTQTLLPLFGTGQLWPVMDKSYPIESTEEAHQRMANNLNSGKIVLTL